MKKFLMITLSIMIGATGLLSFLQPTDLQLATKNLSEISYDLFGGSTSNIYATFVTGEREDPYVLNGINEKLVDFGIITVYFLNDTSSLIGIPTYKLTIDDKYYTGELEQNPFGKNYIADVQVVASDTSQVYLLVEWDTLYETLKLDPISPSWGCNHSKALQLALANIGPANFNKLVENNKLKAEVHVQIVGDSTGVLKEHYWYITIYGQNGSVITVVVNPTNSQIVSKRVVVY